MTYDKSASLIPFRYVNEEQRQINRLRGRRIREIRKKRHMTQERLAELVGLTKDAMSRVERGVNGTTVARLHKMAEVLGVDLTEFFRTIMAAHNMAPPIDEPEWLREPRASMVRDAPSRFLPFEIPPEEFVEGDYDYMQTWRGGSTAVSSGAMAGPLGEVDVSGQSTEVLNPTLRDIQSGRYGVVRVKGDSMLPRLKDGDLVLIDTFDKKPGPTRIMAVYRRRTKSEKGGSALGYIHAVDGQIILTKANPAYPPIILTDRELIQGVVKKRLEEDLE